MSARAGGGRVTARPEHYGDAIADVYDEILEPMSADTAAAVDFLAGLAPGGRALELGVGTGRVALPLARRGLAVHGVDASARMAAALRAKDPTALVTTAVGDICELDRATVGPAPFDLVFIVFNTLYAVLTQDRQVDCVAGAARALAPTGRLVVEAFVPRPERYDDRLLGGPDRLTVSAHDAPAQVVAARQAIPGPAGLRLLPVRLRYVWPAELDLMARLCGLRLVARHGGWAGEPFSGTADRHVSIYAPEAPKAPVGADGVPPLYRWP